MAIPGTNKSVVLGVDVSSFENPLATSIALDPLFACPSVGAVSAPGLTLKAACLRLLGGARFVQAGGAVDYEQPLRIDLAAELSIPLPGFPPGELTIVCDVTARFRITGAVVPGTPWSVALTLSYDAADEEARLDVVSNTLGEPFRSQIEAQVAATLHALLGGATRTTTLPLGVALGTRTPLAPPGLLPADLNAAGSTLLVGVAVADDADGSAGAFPSSYSPSTFPAVTEWAMEIDADSLLAELRAMGTAPGLVAAVALLPGLAGFAVTGTSAAVLFWSGDAVPSSIPGVGGPQPVDAGDRADMANQAPDHPVWFLQPLTFTATVGFSIPLAGYAFGHVVLAPDGNGGLTAQPRIQRVRCFGFDLSFANVPDPAPQSFPGATGFPIVEVGFDAQRLLLLGADEGPVYGGPPELVAPESVAWSNLEGVCQPSFGSSAGDAEVVERIFVANEGGSPLWICSLQLEQDGSDFSLSPADFALEDLPFALAPGDARAIDVTYAPEEPGSGSASLVLATNDCAAPLQRIALDAERATDASVAAARALCFQRPGNIDPQEWFEDLQGFTRALEEEIDVADGGLTILEAYVQGLDRDALVAAEPTGGLEATAQRLADGWRLALPLGYGSVASLTTSATRWDQEPRVQLQLSDTEVVGRVEHGLRPGALAADGPLVVALAGDALQLAVLGTGPGLRAAGALELEGALDVGLTGTTVLVHTANELVLVDAADPDRPRAVGRQRIPEGADVRLCREGWMTLQDDRVEVVAVEAGRARLVASHTFGDRLEGVLEGPGGSLFVGAERAYLVPRLDARGFAATRPRDRARLSRATLRLAAEPRAPRTFLDRGALLVDGATPRGGFVVRRRIPSRLRLSTRAATSRLGGHSAADEGRVLAGRAG